uniref:B-cell receptor CD22-like isoform X1 n=1 Tax=Crassostrea virginica TaxID=6565 RepID=A0A8B8DJ68_CRAVI|nr:B-cell receptor CD22-like isoform X1 [Crassostrea virginica]
MVSSMAFYQIILYGLLFWLSITDIADGITLTVTPSTVAENQTVTLQCELDPDPIPPISAFFIVQSPSTVLCQLEPNAGACKNTNILCRTQYNGSCPTDRLYSIQVPVPREWNGRTFLCQDFYAKSNNVVISVKVPITSITLTPTTVAVIDGQQMHLMCTTSYCNPQANIKWYKSSVDITSQANDTTENRDGLVRTVSSLISTMRKADNGKQVYCWASNSLNVNVTSIKRTLNIMYKPEVGVVSTIVRVKEGETATLECKVTDANPNNSITWKWIKTDSPNSALYNGPRFMISNIQKGRAGSYSCTASNTVGTSDEATIKVDVQYKPEVGVISTIVRVREGEAATLECKVTDANPNNSITWKWIQTDSPNSAFHNGSRFIIYNIQRGRAGSYSCTASNTAGTSDAAIVEVDVQYKPEVRFTPPNLHKVREGETATLECKVTDANPNNSITWKWIKTDSPNSALHNGSRFIISKIQRGRAGSYSCTASNTVGTSDAATVNVDVLYKPSIEEKDVMIVNKSDSVVLTRQIFSNPLSNVSWLDGTQQLKSESLVNIATLFIDSAKCTDTKNFTLVASNSLEWNASSMVELIVNCKPTPDVTNITLGISNNSWFIFSTIVIAYPKPNYALLFGNRTKNNEIVDSITVNALNNFTVHFNKLIQEPADYGTYHLHINNTFGETTVFINVVPESK